MNLGFSMYKLEIYLEYRIYIEMKFKKKLNILSCNIYI